MTIGTKSEPPVFSRITAAPETAVSAGLDPSDASSGIIPFDFLPKIRTPPLPLGSGTCGKRGDGFRRGGAPTWAKRCGSPLPYGYAQLSQPTNVMADHALPLLRLQWRR